MKNSIFNTINYRTLICFFIMIFLLNMKPTYANSEGTPTYESINNENLNRYVNSFFPKQMKKLNIPGLVFTLVKDGEICVKKGFGKANLENNTQVDPDKTLFCIGSIAKTITATAVMQLQESGLIDLNAHINKYLKRYKVPNVNEQPITMSNLLTHTAGFDQRLIGRYEKKQSELKSLETYLKERMPPIIRPSGGVSSYSNHGYALAGFIVEEISGAPFKTYVQNHIFKPLEMNNSYYRLNQDLFSNLAKGYTFGNGGYRTVRMKYFNIPPAGGLYTTGLDMGNFIIAHLQNGHYKKRNILMAPTVTKMHQLQFTNHKGLPGWCFGFYEYHTGQNIRAIMHDGEQNGFYSIIFLLPESNIGFYLSCNSISGGRKISRNFIRQFMRKYFSELEIKPQFNEKIEISKNHEKLIGKYRFDRYAHRSIEKLLIVPGEMNNEIPVYEVAYNDDEGGSLKLKTPWYQGEYIEVEPQLFMKVSGKSWIPQNIAFRKDTQGKITHLLIKQNAYEKISWYESSIPWVVIETICLCVFLSTCLFWPIEFIIRRVRRNKNNLQADTTKNEKLAHLIGGIAAFLCLVLGVLIEYFFYFVYNDQCGIPLYLNGLLILPVFIILCAFGMFIYSLIAWKNKYWGIFGRVHYTLVLLSLLAFIPIIIRFNLLTFRI